MRQLRGALLALVALTLPAAPAAAHSGGRAQLYVDSVRLQPRAGGWQAELVVRDADSGGAEPGVGVQLTASSGAGPVLGPVPLTDADGDGRYAAAIPLTAGSWTVTVNADEIPGGPRALPFTRTWSATLEPGRPLDLGGSGSRFGDGGGGGGVPAVPLGLGLVSGAALLIVWRVRRSTGALEVG
jgi:hypothetical protein